MEIRPWKNVWRKWRSPEFSGCCGWCGGSQFGTSPWRKGGTLSFLLSSNKFHPNVQTCFFYFLKLLSLPQWWKWKMAAQHNHYFPVSFFTCRIQGYLLVGWTFYSDLIYAITWQLWLYQRLQKVGRTLSWWNATMRYDIILSHSGYILDTLFYPPPNDKDRSKLFQSHTLIHDLDPTKK